MDLLKLFALLVAVFLIQVNADAAKKKIRIHLPQKVKHIHHHKKIYITNHPATSQYAPAFTEGAMAVPSNVAMPAVAKVLSPLNSFELYDEPPSRLPIPSSSKLLPLYRARGHYGPAPNEWDDPEDLAPPPEQMDVGYVPTAFDSPSPAPFLNRSPKRVKIIKVEEPPKKKATKKKKSKRILVQNKPQVEEEHPVSTFHEQFYADLDGKGATIRKIKKPQRIEKIIDGDTEHIHTYTEEHIHKLVFNDGSRLAGVVGMDPVAHGSSHSLHPVKNSHTLMSMNGDPLAGYTQVGAMDAPGHFEYAGYNPREVTHDHIFHDHGEIPSELDITKDHLSYPPKYSYNSHGIRLGVGNGAKAYKSKHSQHYLKPANPTQLNDYSYYDSLYSPYNMAQNWQKHTNPTQFESAYEAGDDDYRSVPFKLKEKTRVKPRNVVPALHFDIGKQVTDHRIHQAPYTVSSTVVHDYNPNLYSEQSSGNIPTGSGLSHYNRDMYNYPKFDSYDFDSLISSSSSYGSQSGKYPSNNGKKKKKSISTQNIRFGELDHQPEDHLIDSDASATSIVVSGPDSYNAPSPSTFTIKESSPAHAYYSAMAVKALHGDVLSVAEASNDNFQYADPPSPSSSVSLEPTTMAPLYYDIEDPQVATTEFPDEEVQQRLTSQDTGTVPKEPKRWYKILPLQSESTQIDTRGTSKRTNDASSSGNKLKYGDKI